MKPGIHADIPNEEYHNGPGISSSGIKKLLDCPRKFHWEYILGNREPASDAMELGTLFHTAVLEPDKFKDSFLVNDDHRSSKAFKEFKADHPGEIIIKTPQMEQLRLMFDAVMAHPVARALLESAGAVEQSYAWTDKDTGTLCKVRPDKLSLYKGRKLLVDLKTAATARPEDYEKAIYNFHYHLSAAMYLEGVVENNDPHEAFVHIVVEKKAPFITEVYNLDQKAMETGMEQFRVGLELYKECTKTGVWPGYTDGTINDIGIPYWAGE
jgi:hypothetical protein